MFSGEIMGFEGVLFVTTSKMPSIRILFALHGIMMPNVLDGDLAVT